MKQRSLCILLAVVMTVALMPNISVLASESLTEVKTLTADFSETPWGSWGSWTGSGTTATPISMQYVDGAAEDGVGRALLITGGNTGEGAYAGGQIMMNYGFDLTGVHAFRFRYCSTKDISVFFSRIYNVSVGDTLPEIEVNEVKALLGEEYSVYFDSDNKCISAFSSSDLLGWSDSVELPSTDGEWKTAEIPISAFGDYEYLSHMKTTITERSFAPGYLLRFNNCTFGPDTSNYFKLGSVTGVWYEVEPTIQYSGTCGDNLTWTLDENGTLTISGTGAMADYDDNHAPWYSYSPNIGKVIITNGVTSIGHRAFSHTGLTSITIPDSVATIGNSAFASCTSLTSITIPDSVTSIGDGAFTHCTSLTGIDVSANNGYYSSVDGNLFNEDKTTLIQYAIGKTDTEYAIPDSVTSIGEGAFEFCDSLTSVTISDSVTSIGEGAFEFCDSLTDVYYSGTEEEWNNITIGKYNEPLTQATIHYNYIKEDVTVAAFEANYQENFEDYFEGMKLVDVTLSEGNGEYAVKVGGCELFYSAERGCYAGLVSDGSTADDVVIDKTVAPEVFYYGDVEYDADIEPSELADIVDAADLLFMKAALSGLMPLERYIAYDVDASGSFDAADLLLMKYFISGKLSSFPAAE